MGGAHYAKRAKIALYKDTFSKKSFILAITVIFRKKWAPRTIIVYLSVEDMLFSLNQETKKLSMFNNTLIIDTIIKYSW